MSINEAVAIAKKDGLKPLKAYESNKYVSALCGNDYTDGVMDKLKIKKLKFLLIF